MAEIHNPVKNDLDNILLIEGNGATKTGLSFLRYDRRCQLSQCQARYPLWSKAKVLVTRPTPGSSTGYRSCENP